MTRSGVGDERAARFNELQARLGPGLEANTPGSAQPHVCIVLPSFSVGESLLSHYANRIPALEHRYLLSTLMLHRIESCEIVFLCSVAPTRDMIEYYASLVPAAARAGVRDRIRIFEIPDRSARSVAAKLLDRTDLLDELRDTIAGRAAFIEPWNVTEHEVDVALQLGAPINGTSPDLWPLGFKSAGRKLFEEAGVPIPLGVEDVRSVGDVVAAVADIRRRRADLEAVIIKHDNSGAGDGNVVLELDGMPVVGADAEIESRVLALPDWFLTDLKAGGVVEERIQGTGFSSPSAQVDIRPDGSIRVLATHEQELAGEHAQVYSGCRFPASPAYASRLADYAAAIGTALSARGARGRLAVDFAVAMDDDGSWGVYALEVNLRKGGTTHPYVCLRHLVPGSYDAPAGAWRAEVDGSPRWYCSTDNLLDPAWTGLRPQVVIHAVESAGLAFDGAAGAGVVLHMLSCLEIDGRFGLTAIGRTAEEAATLYGATGAAVTAATQRPIG